MFVFFVRMILELFWMRSGVHAQRGKSWLADGGGCTVAAPEEDLEEWCDDDECDDECECDDDFLSFFFFDDSKDGRLLLLLLLLLLLPLFFDPVEASAVTFAFASFSFCLAIFHHGVFSFFLKTGDSTDSSSPASAAGIELQMRPQRMTGSSRRMMLLVRPWESLVADGSSPLLTGPVQSFVLMIRIPSPPSSEWNLGRRILYLVILPL
jgi:hypothetical protein